MPQFKGKCSKIYRIFYKNLYNKKLSLLAVGIGSGGCRANYCQTPEKIFLTAIAIRFKSSFTAGGEETPLRSPASNCCKPSTDSKCSAEINCRSALESLAALQTIFLKPIKSMSTFRYGRLTLFETHQEGVGIFLGFQGGSLVDQKTAGCFVIHLTCDRSECN